MALFSKKTAQQFPSLPYPLQHSYHRPSLLPLQLSRSPEPLPPGTTRAQAADLNVTDVLGIHFGPGHDLARHRSLRADQWALLETGLGWWGT